MTRINTDGQRRAGLCLGKPSWRCFAQKSFGKNTGLRLVSKRGDVVKKHPQARLRGSFHNRSSIRAANQPL